MNTNSVNIYSQAHGFFWAEIISLNPKPQFDYARTVRSVDITMGFTIIKTIVLEIQIRENPVFSQEWFNIFSHMSDESPHTLLVDEISEYPDDLRIWRSVSPF